MKKYRLKKDLPTFKAGDKFCINECGDLVLDIPHNNDEQTEYGITAYCARTLEKFPNILTDWFEEVKEKKSVWELEDGDPCYVVSITNYGAQLEKFTFSSDPVKNIPMNARRVGALFTSEEDTWKYYHKCFAEATLKRDTHGFEPDWGNSKQNKYTVYYDSDNGYFDTAVTTCFCTSEIFFKSEKDARQSIAMHSKEWLTYFGVKDN